MGEPQFICKTHDAPVYGPSHIVEHKATCPGWCEIVEIGQAPIETPEESRFDITNDPRSA